MNFLSDSINQIEEDFHLLTKTIKIFTLNMINAMPSSFIML